MPILAAILGAICLVALLFAPRQIHEFYNRREPNFSAPIHPVNHRILLRRDGYGKGYFGAPRSGGRSHQGIDLLSPVGTPVYASKSGRVIAASEEKGFGQYIKIAHPDGFITCYAHLSQLLVQEGDWIKIQQLIGKTGKTGNADNPNILGHLHFEVKSHQKALDPTHLFGPTVEIR